MADGEVTINATLDQSGLDKGLKDMQGKLDKASKSVNDTTKKTKSFGDTLKGMSTSAVAAGAAVAGVAVAVKKTVDALNDCEKAYQVQRKAEIALQTAAKNNPYLNDESVYNLRRYASELQGVSEIGDEVSLRVMSTLAAAGRTEEQIQEIMSAAADMAAVTGQDIASAAQQLNMTLNGNAGTLGRQIESINNLTKEELANGKAIELVAKQYKGAAAATADTTVQLSNAWGDFKENIGRGWNKVTQPVKQFFLDILNDINEATAKTNDLKDASGKRNAGTATSADTKIILDDAQQHLDSTKKAIDETMEILNNEELLAKKVQESRGYVTKATYQKSLTALQKRYEEQTKTVQQLTEEYNNLSEAEKKAADAAAAQASAEEKAAALKKRDEEATEYIKANEKALQDQIKAIRLKAEVTGEEINQEEIYQAYLNSYIDLISKSNGLVTENNSAAKKRLEALQKEAEALKEINDEKEREAKLKEMQKEADELLKDIDAGKHKTAFDEYDEKNKQLDEWKTKVEEMASQELITEQDKNDALLEIDRQYWQNKKDLAETLTGEINGYIQQTADIAKEAGDLMLDNLKTETETELAELETKYQKGELSEEEYYEKQKQIKQKAAREEYKIKMFEWTASLLAATANIAEGVSKAIAQGGVAGIVTGALVAAAGGVQMASIIASKPQPPSFYTGGIIGGANGATMGGDNTYIHARAGEMVLNAAQQRNLWDMINGQNGRGESSLDVTVNNTQSGRVDTQLRQEDGALILDIVDKRVNAGLIDGTYDGGYASMLSRQEGVKIL